MGAVECSRSKVTPGEEPESAEEWSLGVGELPPNVQDVFVKEGVGEVGKI